MSAKAEEIFELISSSGLSAPEMTHSLKMVGDGDMQKGFLHMARFFHSDGFSEGVSVGTKRGFIQGALGALGAVALVGGIYVTGKINERKRKTQLENEGKKILNTLKETKFTEEATTTRTEPMEEGEENEK